jgi:hypothetical protein
MQQNDSYNIPLPRGPGSKKKDNERGINYPGWIKNVRFLTGTQNIYSGRN